MHVTFEGFRNNKYTTVKSTHCHSLLLNEQKTKILMKQNKWKSIVLLFIKMACYDRCLYNVPVGGNTYPILPIKDKPRFGLSDPLNWPGYSTPPLSIILLFHGILRQSCQVFFHCNNKKRRCLLLIREVSISHGLHKGRAENKRTSWFWILHSFQRLMRWWAMFFMAFIWK